MNILFCMWNSHGSQNLMPRYLRYVSRHQPYKKKFVGVDLPVNGLTFYEWIEKASHYEEHDFIGHNFVLFCNQNHLSMKFSKQFVSELQMINEPHFDTFVAYFGLCRLPDDEKEKQNMLFQGRYFSYDYVDGFDMGNVIKELELIWPKWIQEITNDQHKS